MWCTHSCSSGIFQKMHHYFLIQKVNTAYKIIANPVFLFEVAIFLAACNIFQLNLQTLIRMFGTIDRTQFYRGRLLPLWLFTGCHLSLIHI